MGKPIAAPQFVAEEVWKVARALLDNAHSYEVTHGRNAYNECNHCRGNVYHDQDVERIQHEADCPVLVARDLLTGAPS